MPVTAEDSLSLNSTSFIGTQSRNNLGEGSESERSEVIPLAERHHKFTPLRKNTLYSFLFEKPTDIELEDFVERFVDTIKKSEAHFWAAARRVIQLFVDLSGYQRFIINQNRCFYEIIDKLEDENSNPEYFLVTDYILNLVEEGSRTYLRQESIYKFISTIVVKLHNADCYEFICKIQEFVCHMGKACAYPLVHTGVIISMKIIRTTAQIILKLEESIDNINYKLNDQQQTSEQKNSLLHSLRVAITKLNNCQDIVSRMYLQVFSRRCNYEDRKNKLVGMRVQCVQEICVWLKDFAIIFLATELKIHENLITYLKNERSIKVVKTAVYACLELFKNENFKKNVSKSIIEKIIRNVASLCKCIDEDVAVAAFQILTLAVTENIGEIPLEYKYNKFNLTNACAENIAKASGKLIIAQIRSESRSSNEILLIELYVRMVTKFKENNYYKLRCAVKATYEDLPEFQNWSIIFRLLLERKEEKIMSEEEYEVLCFIVFQVAEAVVNNKVTSKNSSVPSVQSNIDNFNEHFIKTAHQLIVSFQEEKGKLKLFLRMINLIDSHYLKDAIFQEPLQILVKLLLHLLLSEDNLTICKLITKSLKHLGKEENLTCVIKNQLEDFVNNIALKMCPFQNDDLDGSLTIIENECQLTSLVAIYEHYSFNHKIQWRQIFFDWDLPELKNVHSPVIIGHYLSTCSYWLYWETENLLSKDPQKNFADAVDTLMTKCEDYINVCVPLLDHGTQEDSQNMQRMFAAYMGVCRGFCTFKKLQKSIEITEDDDVTYSGVGEYLVKFLNVVAFKEFEKYPFSLRLEALLGFKDLIEAECLSPTWYSYFFMHMHSHRHVYGDFFEKLLKNLSHANKQAVPFLIVNTLQNLLDDIQPDSEEVDFLEITVLSKYFVSKIKHCQDTLKYIFKFSINMVLNENCGISHLLKLFANELKAPSTEEIGSYFKEQLEKCSEDFLLSISNTPSFKIIQDMLKE